MTVALQKIEFHSVISAMQVWQNLPEGIRAEVIDNKLYVLASPTPYHQDVLATLYRSLYDLVSKFDLGKIWFAPIDVFPELPEKTVVIPDLVFVAHGNKTRIEGRGLFGSPDLLIEILSPGTQDHDFVTKKDIYERTGVKEYWLVDPETKDAAGYHLKNGVYDSPLILNSKIQIRILDKTITF